MFVDTAKIKVTAGHGGAGAVSFHREKYISAGGPDGGDGGRGGNIVVRTDTNLSTLMDFRYKRKYTAANGEPGGSRNKSGKSGRDLIITVPLGTVIRDELTGTVIKDMSDSEDFLLARGGRGGWGNQHFATPTRQCPRFAKTGLPGIELEIILELKLLADVGLVGFPNVGKSTLLSVVSAARPKIADYHFTTLSPNLGIVSLDVGTSCVWADIPGIIEGASEGVGLGLAFLRHIDRCRLLLHLVDVSGCEGRDPVEDFIAINRELESFGLDLASRVQIVVANKCDAMPQDSENLQKLRAFVEPLELFEISAAARTGVDALVKRVFELLATLPPPVVYESDYVPPMPELGDPQDVAIESIDDVWYLEGLWLERLVSNVNFSDYESRMFFDRMLKKAGLFERLESMGLKDGDTISIYDMEFTWKP